MESEEAKKEKKIVDGKKKKKKEADDGESDGVVGIGQKVDSQPLLTGSSRVGSSKEAG